jgi:hypothetical protein
MRPFPPKAFYGFVTSTTTSVASGWNDQLPGGYLTHGKSKPFHGARPNGAQQSRRAEKSNW